MAHSKLAKSETLTDYDINGAYVTLRANRVQARREVFVRWDKGLIENGEFMPAAPQDGAALKNPEKVFSDPRCTAFFDLIKECLEAEGLI